jgi:hypothetical protein
MRDFWEFENNPPTIQEVIKKLQEYVDYVGPGSHNIVPYIDVETEDFDDEYKFVGIKLATQFMCGCPIGITLMIEKK